MSFEEKQQEFLNSDFYDEVTEYISTLAECPEDITESLVCNELSYIVDLIVSGAQTKLEERNIAAQTISEVTNPEWLNKKPVQSGIYNSFCLYCQKTTPQRTFQKPDGNGGYLVCTICETF